MQKLCWKLQVLTLKFDRIRDDIRVIAIYVQLLKNKRLN